jgi:predicted HicB family RNase H-like nuclease
MASGPEHYREAERLLEQAEVDARDPMRKYAEDGNVIAAAQVHATLALAAATARPAVKEWIGDELHDGSDWTRVTS